MDEDENKLTDDDVRNYRKELWIGVAIAVSRAEAARSPDVPAKWANKVLAEYDLAFNKGK